MCFLLLILIGLVVYNLPPFPFGRWSRDFCSSFSLPLPTSYLSLSLSLSHHSSISVLFSQSRLSSIQSSFLAMILQCLELLPLVLRLSVLRCS